MPQSDLKQRLSDLQQKILEHSIECKERNESVSHISRELNALQPAVFRSIDSLIEEGYVKKEKDYTGREKLLRLTDKGAAVGFLLAARNQEHRDKLGSYFGKKLGSNLRTLYQVVYREEPDNRESVINKAMEYWLKNDLFRQEKIDTHKLTTLFLEAALESKSALNQPESIKELIEKYGLDKNFIINALEKKREAIDLLISELRGSDRTAQTATGLKNGQE
jgi:DNA-binding MarR family transcriptional regulator